MMWVEVFAVCSWLAMFLAFYWSARAPRKVVAMRRSLLLEDGPVSAGDVWIIRALGAFCIGRATWASVISGHAALAWWFVPAAIIFHGFIELMRYGVVARVAGRHWTVRLGAVVLWAMAAGQWQLGSHGAAWILAVFGLGIAIWPAPVARTLANYASEETQVRWTKWSGIVGCVISLAVAAGLLRMLLVRR
jgi:hypothetical protein